MKKTLSLACYLFLILLFSSCFTPDEKKIDNAKKDLWIVWNNTQEESIKVDITQESTALSENSSTPLEDNSNTSNNELKHDSEQDSNPLKDSPSFEIVYESSNKFIEVYTLPSSEISFPEVKISWKTLVNVDKIKVSFSNDTSNYPEDDYTLTRFKPWDKTFVYHASPNFEVLDYGKNLYSISAYSWDEISRVDIAINIPENTETFKNKEITYEKKLIWGEDDKLYMSFPKSDSFWEAILDSPSSFTYSKIDNLKVEKLKFDEIQCDWVTDYLIWKIKSLFYWNTCREIVKDKWISFYVVRLDWDKYFYEKYYIDNYHSLIWNYLIETWVLREGYTIKEKNKNLKEKKRRFWANKSCR